MNNHTTEGTTRFIRVVPSNFVCLREVCLFDVCAYLGEVALHVFLVTVVDDVDEFLHFLANLCDLILGVRVEENLTQQTIVLAQYSLCYLHVTLERGAWSILVLHDRCEGKGRNERDAERVCHSFVVLLERVFADVQLEFVVELLEEASSHEVALADDDGVLGRQLAEVGECWSEHRVGAHVSHTGILVVVLESRLHAADVAEDAGGWEVRNDLVEYGESVFEADGVDDEFWLERLDFVHRSETLAVVSETQTLGIYLVNCYLVVE